MDQKTKSAVSRTKILDAAVKEFSHIRYEKASVNQICRDGQITKGRLYYYFESKDQLYLAALQYCLERMKENLLAFEPDPSLSMEENILRFFAAWQDVWKRNMNFAFFMGRAKLSPPDHLREPVIEMIKVFRNEVLLVKWQEIFQFYFPDDQDRQKLFSMISNITIQYISVCTGLPRLDNAKNDPNLFFDRQMAIFKSLVHIFLHGCMNVEVPQLRDGWPDYSDFEL